MKRMFSAIWVILGFAWVQSAMADPSLKDLAARTELRAIETLTLTDQQFLTGDKNGKAVTIAGQLRFPFNMVLDGYRAFEVLANHPSGLLRKLSE